MRVLVISYYYPPLQSVASARPYSFAQGLFNAGHEVSVLTSASRDKVIEGANATNYDYEVLEARSAILDLLLGARKGKTKKRNIDKRSSDRSGLIYRFLNNWRIRRGLLVLGRMPDLMSLWAKPALQLVKGRQWDVVISTYAPYGCHQIARQLKKISPHIFWIADFRDPWTENHNFKGLFPFTLIEDFLEKQILREADLVTTVSEVLRDRFAERGAGAVEIVPNGYDQSLIDGLDDSPILPSDQLSIVHTGTLYPGNDNYHTLFEALRLLLARRPGCTNLKVVVAGTDLAQIQERVDSAELGDHFEFRGLVPNSDALRMQRDCKALIFFDMNDFPGVTTGKIFEYIASGRPVIHVGGSGESSARQLLDRSGLGIPVGRSAEKLADALEKLCDGELYVDADMEQIRLSERTIIAKEFIANIVDHVEQFRIARSTSSQN